ncbi:MAG: hypothetical protein AAGK97_03965 [Bacteroidota bacterium]
MDSTEYLKQPKIKILSSNLKQRHQYIYAKYMLGLILFLVLMVFITGPLLSKMQRAIFVIVFFAYAFVEMKRFEWTTHKPLLNAKNAVLKNDYTEIELPDADVLKIKSIEQIVFKLQGDIEGNPIKDGIRAFNPGDLHHNQIVMDQIHINENVFFVEILNKEDQHNFLKFANQMHHYNKKAKLFIASEEIELPVDINRGL